MVDAAAAFIGLASTAGVVGQRIYKYIKSVQHADCGTYTGTHLGTHFGSDALRRLCNGT